MFGPVEVMVPQVGLQVVRFGAVMVVVAVDWVISQVTPRFCRSFARVTVKPCGSLGAMVAVLGGRLRPMPESRISFFFPGFLVSFLDLPLIKIFTPVTLILSRPFP